MFGITGAGLGALKRYQNEGKNPRYSLDHWDKVSLIMSRTDGERAC